MFISKLVIAIDYSKLDYNKLSVIVQTFLSPKKSTKVV